MSARDPRLTLARPDLAAEALRGAVEAARFAAPRPMAVTVPVADLVRRPGEASGLDTQLLAGERFDVLDEADGWCWGQAASDGYVGHVRAAALGRRGPTPTHRVATRTAQLYPEPDIKARARATLPFAARLAVSGEVAARGSSRPMAVVEGGFVPLPQLAPLDRPAPDWVAVAEGFAGCPYLWGGRSVFGLDCSALIQLAREAAGHACPRDSDMQAAALGATLAPGTTPRRGDLVFWRGHVGVMLDETRLLHANAFHMAAAVEPLAEAAARIEAVEGSPVTRHARLD